MIDIRVTLTFTEEVLGTAPADPDLYREHIASQRPEGVDEAEVESLPPVDEVLESKMTVFRRDAQDRPVVYDYQIKGFFKDACSMLRRADEGVSTGLQAHKKVIDGMIFVRPRQIPIILPEGAELGVCERPLRAGMPKGERVALSRSETAPAGSTCEFTVTLLRTDLVDFVNAWLEYGELRGLGQWRNSGKGTFTYTSEVVNE